MVLSVSLEIFRGKKGKIKQNNNITKVDKPIEK